MTTVDQQTRRRIMRTGVTAFDPGLACPGYVLFNTSGAGDAVYLMGLDGAIVHHWTVPYPPRYGYLLPNGNLFLILKAGGETEPMFPGWPVHQDGLMLEMDWQGNILWEHRDPYQHHDARRTESGGAIYLTAQRMPDDLAARLKGGAPGRPTRPMWADVLVEVDADGHRVWEWRAADHLDPERDVIELGDAGHEWSHGNTIAPLDGDRVLVSFRSISLVAIIDKQSSEMTWRLGDDVLAQQHDANMLANGNILIFDNGSSRRSLPQGFSRVIEVDPLTNEIVWEYRDSPASNFFSPTISGARRLPNGNTLITEGRFGRLFQVTPDKQVVWEYVNPHFLASREGPASNAIFRATHYERLPVNR
ncbi:MAG TPA: aryl-sulfate sulfotransferase [Dehalococcoidia bacterium]|nr:aryl-sulfate sulfotransferase [Dehalococcoidia bacterium]